MRGLATDIALFTSRHVSVQLLMGVLVSSSTLSMPQPDMFGWLRYVEVHSSSATAAALTSAATTAPCQGHEEPTSC